MPYSLTGHRVQVWKPSYVDPHKIDYVKVGSWRTLGYYSTISRQERHAGWYYVKGSLNKRTAIKLAKDLKKLDFHSRVVLRDNKGADTVIAEFKNKGV